MQPTASPSTPAPNLPALNPINHQAAGLDLGCASCSGSALALADVAPKTAAPGVKLAVGLGILAAFGGFAFFMARR